MSMAHARWVGTMVTSVVASLALSACGGRSRGATYYYGNGGPSAYYGGSARPAPSATSEWEAEVSYEPPSPLSRWGFRVLVLPFDNENSTGITQRMAHVIDATRSFDVVTSGAVHMAVSGAVQERRVGDEAVEVEPARCVRTLQETRTRRVPYEVEDPAPTPSAQTREQNYQQLGEAIGNLVVAAAGGTPRSMGRRTHTEFREEEYTVPVEQPYRCQTVIRHVDATFRLHVQVMARTRPVRVVYQRDFSEHDEVRTTGRRGSDDSDQEPEPVDGEALLRSLQERALEAFARENLPQSASETLRFEACGDARCEATVGLVRAQNFDEAIRSLTELVEQDAQPRHHRAVAYMAAALYDLGLARTYSGQFATGIDAMGRAIAMSPGHDEWEARLARIREMQSAVGVVTPPTPAPRTGRPAPPGARRPAR